MSDTDAEKITIVEGPPPIFEKMVEPWLYGVAEGPQLKRVVRCLVRTFNGHSLVERCTHAWREGRDVFLDYKQHDGLRQQALILAARCDKVPEGHLLLLWVRLESLLDDDVNDELGIDADGDNPFS